MLLSQPCEFLKKEEKGNLVALPIQGFWNLGVFLGFVLENDSVF